MAIGHIAVRVHSRKRGHTVAAALAYRCGLNLRCERTGEHFDFRRRAARSEIAATGFVGTAAPGRYPPGRMQRVAQVFADAVENAERRSNSAILRDVQMALPHELVAEDRIALTERFAARISDRYNVPAAFAVHAPDPVGDARNHHAHIAFPTRDRDGKKLRVLDDRKTGPAEIKVIRDLWEALANEALVAANLSPDVDTGRRLNPQPTLGSAPTAIERRHRRTRELPYEGKSVARFCADGHNVTGAGRRLERHVREKAAAAAEQMLEAERQADEVAALPDESRSPAKLPETETPIPLRQPSRRRRRRRKATRQVAVFSTVDDGLSRSPAEPPETETPIALRNPTRRRRRRRNENRQVTFLPTVDPAGTPELQAPPNPQDVDRAIRALEQKRVRLALAPPPSLAPEAFDLIEKVKEREAQETTVPISAADIDWRTVTHVAPDAEPSASPAQRPPHTAQDPSAPTPTPALQPTTFAAQGVDLSTLRHVPPEAAPSAPRAAELTEPVHAIKGMQPQHEHATQTRPERPPDTREPHTPTPAAEPPTAREERRANPSEPLTPESFAWRTTEHLEPQTVQTRRKPRSTAELEAWSGLGGVPVSTTELHEINNQLAGSSAQPSLAAALDAIARSHLEGRAPADRLQNAFDTLRGVLQSEDGAMRCAHGLIAEIDEHQAASYGRSPSDGSPLAPPPDPQRVAAAIKSWRATPILKQIREIALPFELLALRADTRRVTARAKREQRTRFGALSRHRSTENTDDGQDR